MGRSVTRDEAGNTWSRCKCRADQPGSCSTSASRNRTCSAPSRTCAPTLLTGTSNGSFSSTRMAARRRIRKRLRAEKVVVSYGPVQPKELTADPEGPGKELRVVIAQLPISRAHIRTMPRLRSTLFMANCFIGVALWTHQGRSLRRPLSRVGTGRRTAVPKRPLFPHCWLCVRRRASLGAATWAGMGRTPVSTKNHLMEARSAESRCIPSYPRHRRVSLARAVGRRSFRPWQTSCGTWSRTALPSCGQAAVSSS